MSRSRTSSVSSYIRQYQPGPPQSPPRRNTSRNQPRSISRGASGRRASVSSVLRPGIFFKWYRKLKQKCLCLTLIISLIIVFIISTYFYIRLETIRALRRSNSPKLNFTVIIMDRNCSGTIVSPTWSLTAAHCIWDPSNSSDNQPLRLVAAKDQNDIEHADKDYIRTSEKLFVHDNYKLKRNHSYDIALIKLSEPFSFQKGITLIPLSRQMIESQEMKLKTELKSNNPDKSSSTVKKIPEKYFGSKESKVKFLFNQLNSANEYDNTIIINNSGGPVLKFENGSYVQIGIVTQHQLQKKNEKNLLIFIIGVAPFIDWIEKIIKEN